jgi:predicted transcriptional regulator
MTTNLSAYQKNKKHIYAYREKNPEKIREITRRSMRKLRERKRELENIEKTFLNILLEEKL